ncbi:MAG: YicC family protein [Bacteroidales bacterium]|nr:YicC family protein [Bacteroidales bacterium]MBQ5532343.1 YicC family protein [Bacteroidales bacterium]
MLQSMTGFGNSTLQGEAIILTVNIKSINSKQFDFTLKWPSELKEVGKENEIRQLVMERLSRGKIECSVSIDKKETAEAPHINKQLIKQYYRTFREISDELGIHEDLLSIVMKMPDVIESPHYELDDTLWKQLENTIIEACDRAVASRCEEGAALAEDFKKRIQLILDYLDEIEPLENNRIGQIKGRLYKSLADNRDQFQNFDENRLEQEIIFYLEKLDFTEEKVRLRKHCAYFLETMKEPLNGKKLAFISQEIGREINTLGSKACQAEIQQWVVKMKDELEKIKEQLANIL